MRRLHYLAIGVVFLGIVSLAWGRVASTPAYVARVGFGRLRPGMTQSEVRRRMAALKDAQDQHADGCDAWLIDNHYWITVNYEAPATGSGEPVLQSKLLQVFRDGDATDDSLEWLGFPKARLIYLG